MALIDNQTFPFSRLWAKNGIKLVADKSDIFSGSNMRCARVQFIAGKNMLTGIKNWMLAAQLIEPSEKKNYIITDAAEQIIQNDKNLKNSATWWAIHLQICFSNIGEPYASFFSCLDNQSSEWRKLSDLKKQITEKETLEKHAKASIEKSIEGVKSMFIGSSPLAGLGMLDIKKWERAGTIDIKLGTPNVPDEVIVYALSLARHHKFPSRSSISFRELCQSDFSHFLCMSQDKLRKRLKEISHKDRWKNHYSFTQAVDLESIDFLESLDKNKMLVMLLQECRDTWL